MLPFVLTVLPSQSLRVNQVPKAAATSESDTGRAGRTPEKDIVPDIKTHIDFARQIAHLRNFRTPVVAALR